MGPGEVETLSDPRGRAFFSHASHGGALGVMPAAYIPCAPGHTAAFRSLWENQFMLGLLEQNPSTQSLLPNAFLERNVKGPVAAVTEASRCRGWKQHGSPLF